MLKGIKLQNKLLTVNILLNQFKLNIFIHLLLLYRISVKLNWFRKTIKIPS